MNKIRNIIREIITEIHIIGHFEDRLKDRLYNIMTIDFSKDLRQEFNKNNSSENGEIDVEKQKINNYSSYILNLIKTEVKKKIELFKVFNKKEDDILTIYVIAKVLIKYKGKLYSPTLHSIDKPKQVQGNVWYSGVYNNSTRTLLLGKNDNDLDLINEFKQHYSRKEDDADIPGDLRRYVDSNKFNEKTIVNRLKNYEIIIDLDKIIIDTTTKDVDKTQPTITNKETIWNPSYKKDAKFIHQKFGEGIITSSKYLGLIDLKPTYNVEVQFNEPYGTKTIKMIKK